MWERFNDYVPGDDPKKETKGKKDGTKPLNQAIRTGRVVGQLSTEVKKESDKHVKAFWNLVGGFFPEMKKDVDTYLKETNREQEELKKQIEARQRKKKAQEEKLKKELKEAREKQKIAEEALESMNIRDKLVNREENVKKDTLDKKFDTLYEKYNVDYKDNEWNSIQIRIGIDSDKLWTSQDKPWVTEDSKGPNPCKYITISKKLKNWKTTKFTLYQVYSQEGWVRPVNINYRILSIDENGKKISRILETPDEIKSVLSKIETRQKEAESITKKANEEFEKYLEEQRRKDEEQHRKDVNDALKLANKGNHQPDESIDRLENA